MGSKRGVRVMSEDWKDLEIGNIPSDFFVNDRYEIQEYKKSGEWCIFMLRSPICRWETIRNFNTFGYKYRYRLKPLEPIRISQNELEILCDYYGLGESETDTEYLSTKIGRGVELL